MTVVKYLKYRNKTQTDNPACRWKNYRITLSPNERIEVGLCIQKGKVLRFSVTYLYKIKNKWYVVQRCDNAHKERKRYHSKGKYSHCHFYKFKDGESIPIDKTLVAGSDIGKLATEIIKKFRQKREDILTSFLKK